MLSPVRSGKLTPQAAKPPACCHDALAESPLHSGQAEWISLARDLALIGDDLSINDARLIFMWSRMRVIDEDCATARERIENLTFFGFLEAMVRVAQSKALPTDEQVAASGCADGGELLLKLRAEDPTGYREFVAAHDGEWWQPLRQPIANAIKHMLMLVMRTVSATLMRWEREHL